MLELPIPLPGFEPAPEPRKHWVQYEDGTLGRLGVAGDEDPVLPRPGRLITEVEYDRLRTEMTAAHNQRVAELLAAEDLQQRQDYEDLRTLGIPEGMASRLSGYTPPPAPDGPES
ncbi:hypothetical protein PV336_16645 [Streptomyces sp. MI02-2A]|jgi:hypothetical protein|uniref:hypothetical protein n=1 Tax=unclassified Streptomyces TaxID=2593676 RepID=UPI000E2866F7|nr:MULTISPECIES: hypothetical protein [unclassified Streptomyces]MDX3260847.1 hypothetical protein [Streptomyces sp. MI02-2A]REE63981.1 hypothetical protein BX257_6644 [Streptomyces sp. 3212.3]